MTICGLTKLGWNVYIMP